MYIIKKINEFDCVVENNSWLKSILTSLLLLIPMNRSDNWTVKNDSDSVIYVKGEGSIEVDTITPGGVYNGDVDGIRVNGRVFKFINSVDKFGIVVTGDSFEFSIMDEEVRNINDILGGGYLKSIPDTSWSDIFNVGQ